MQMMYVSYLTNMSICEENWMTSGRNRRRLAFEINSSKTEEISVNTIVKQRLRLNGEDSKRSSDFCYLGEYCSRKWRYQHRSKCVNTEGEGIILQIKKSVAIQVITKRH